MPHAIQIRQTGGPEVLNWTPIKVGEPGGKPKTSEPERAGCARDLREVLGFSVE